MVKLVTFKLRDVAVFQTFPAFADSVVRLGAGKTSLRFRMTNVFEAFSEAATVTASARLG